MLQVRACATIAAWIVAAVLISACSSETALPVVAAPPPPAQAAPPEFSPFAPPAEVASEIVRYFLAAGYQRFQADALADHALFESGFRPCVAGPAGLRDTYQWGGTRLHQLYEFAHTQSCPSLDWQLAFADHELRTDPKYACFWYAHTRAEALTALRRGFGRGRC